MKNLCKLLTFSLAIMANPLLSKTPYAIILTFEEYPDPEKIEHLVKPMISPTPRYHRKSEKYARKNFPGITKSRIEKKEILLLGIPIAYYGYMAITSKNGSVILPRMHESLEFYILVCTDVQPIFMLQNTVHHFEVTPGAQYAYYKISKILDENTKTYLWLVEKQEMPANRQLPLETITIFSQPEDIYIPEGISITNENPQAILPIMYVKDDKNYTKNSLCSLDIRYLFDTLEPVQK